VHASLLDEELFQRLLELQESLQGILESPELTSSRETRSRDAGEGVVRSPLQTELILRSLNRSSGNRQVRASL